MNIEYRTLNIVHAYQFLSYMRKWTDNKGCITAKFNYPYIVNKDTKLNNSSLNRQKNEHLIYNSSMKSYKS